MHGSLAFVFKAPLYLSGSIPAQSGKLQQLLAGSALRSTSSTVAALSRTPGEGPAAPGVGNQGSGAGGSWRRLVQAPNLLWLHFCLDYRILVATAA